MLRQGVSWYISIQQEKYIDTFTLRNRPSYLFDRTKAFLWIVRWRKKGEYRRSCVQTSACSCLCRELVFVFHPPHDTISAPVSGLALRGFILTSTPLQLGGIIIALSRNSGPATSGCPGESIGNQFCHQFLSSGTHSNLKITSVVPSLIESVQTFLCRPHLVVLNCSLSYCFGGILLCSLHDVLFT